MRSPSRTARLAGAIYLVSGFPAVYSFLYVPSKLIVSNDAAETTRRISQHSGVYRLAIVADIVNQILFIALGLVLYDLLADVDRRFARAMLALVVVGAAVELANSLNLVAPLILLSGSDFLSTFSDAQRRALALAFLHLRTGGLELAQVFWGLWLAPFGMLVIRSGFFPKVLGVLLLVACVAYVAASFSYVAFPEHLQVMTRLSQLFGALGEGAMILWLLVMGARSAETHSLRAT